ncbi:MAG TPA: hypothetical protein VF990_08640 [Candidatus Dormibacteraeota bacterium]
MVTTARGLFAARGEIRSPSGMWAGFTSSGTLRRFEIDGLNVLLYPASELEAGPANVYLRLKGEPIATTALLGPGSGGSIRWTPDGPDIYGRWRDLEYRAAFRLAAAVPAWFWHLEVVNRSSEHCEVDLIYAQDVALAPYEAVRTNEYYVSQYLDLTPIPTRDVGMAVAVRQNMPGSSAPWVLIGCLREGIGWATDALQLGRSQHPGDPSPGLLTDRLPSTRLQHEHTLVVVQDRSARLGPGERLISGFFGLYRSRHPSATSDADAAEDALALRQPEARPPGDAGPGDGTPVIGSLFSSPVALRSRDLTSEELDRLVGPAKGHAEGDSREPLAFFAADGRHVVLAAKERAVLRPHGHILRTGDGLVPDARSLTSTVWMAGVFHSQVTQGHASLNRILSIKRGYLGWHRACGLRVFLNAGEPDGDWILLDEPSAWAVAPDRCTWWYRHATGLIEVVAGAPAPKHELTLRVRVLEGTPSRLLVCANVALDDDDGQQPEPPQLSIDATGVTVRPPAGSTSARRFPAGWFRLSWPAGAAEQVLGDEALFRDGQSRQLPWVTIRSSPTEDFTLTLTARLLPEPDQTTPASVKPVGDDFWRGLSQSVRLIAPQSSMAKEDVERLDAVLPWFTQNALVHYLSPRGLEQFTGGAWGTRDVCQGPVSLLIALDRMEPLRDLLSRVFRAQHSRGDWPQWFEFFPGEAGSETPDAHGDVIYWPLLALAEYLRASGDASLLREPLPFAAPDGAPTAAPVIEHVRRALSLIAARTIPGTPLPAYGLGDWNDSLRPAHPELAARLCSTWTVTLHIEALRTLAEALRLASDAGQREIAALAGTAEEMAAQAGQALVRFVFDGILAGYGLFRDDGSVEPLVHPADARTGLRYGLLHISSAITSDLFSHEAATRHLALVREHLLGPDGARLFDRPAPYRGGPMEVFQRAEAATFFGREIGLMYMHAHLRYAEALARYGDGVGLLKALNLANPIGLTDRVRVARPRQSTTYFTSSDAVVADRYEAATQYSRVLSGEVPLEAGWRVYSSGPGIFLRLVVECLLGVRRRAQVLEIDPVLDPNLDGLKARIPISGVPVDVAFRVDGRGVGPRSVTFNDARLPTTGLSNPYRPPGFAVEMAAVRNRLRPEENSLVIEVA